MGRRKKLDRYPRRITEGVNAMLQQRKTIDEITVWVNEQLKTYNDSLCRAAVGNYVKDWNNRAKQLEEQRARASGIIQAIKESPNTEDVELAEKLIVAPLVDFLLGIRKNFFEDSNPKDLVNMITALGRSSTFREKLKIDFKREFDKEGAGAFGRFFRDLIEFLKEKDPQSVEILQRNFDAFSEWAAEKYISKL